MSQEIRMGVNYDPSTPDPVRTTVDRCVGQLFADEAIKNFPKKTLLSHVKVYKSLTDEAFLPRRFRNGDQLPDDDKAKINGVAISQAIDGEIPIPVGIVIGTLLNPSARFPEHEQTGFLGTQAINRLLQMDRKVRMFYSQGLELVVFADDSASHWFFDYTSNFEAVEACSSNYLTSLANEIDVIQDAYGNRPIRMVRESEMYAKLGIDHPKYIEICETNHRALEAYLVESGEIIREQQEKGKDWDEYKSEVMNLNSFKVLTDLRWAGEVPPEMRKHYRERLGASQQDLPEDWIDHQMARLFASSLTKRQMNVVGMAVGDVPHLRFGFMTQPPGIDPRLQTIIGISAHPRSKEYSDDRITPPWRGIGHIAVHPVKGRLKANLRISPTDVFDVGEIEGVDKIGAVLTAEGRDLTSFDIALYSGQS